MITKSECKYCPKCSEKLKFDYLNYKYSCKNRHFYSVLDLEVQDANLIKETEAEIIQQYKDINALK